MQEQSAAGYSTKRPEALDDGHVDAMRPPFDRSDQETERLHARIKELEAVNAELQADNEQLKRKCAELHAERYEWDKTIAENKQKIQELMELNNDMNNFLNSTRIGTIFLDKHLRIRRFTPAITMEINLMNVDYGRPLAHISHNFKHDFIRDAEEVLRSLTPIEREILSSTGKWYSMRVMPYRTSSNKVNGIVFTFVDITELKQACEDLVKFSYMIEQSPSNKVILDLNGNIEYANPKFVELTGYDSAELIGKSIRLFNEWGKEAPSFEEVWAQLEKGKIWSGELEGRTKEGQTFWESVRMLPIQNNEGDIVHYFRVSEDITNLKQTEELLRKSEMLSGIGQLAAGIAHEIRNPLTALKGFTQLMSSGVVNEKYVAIMRNELNRIEEIVSELLVLSKPQAVDYYEKDVLSILKDVMMLLDTQAIMSKVEIQLDAPLSEARISCVENQLKQVFINVMQNAIEAMPNGGSIFVEVHEDAECYRIDIRDTGFGIPEQNLPRLGEPFFSTKETGTGLGLMVSYKIIEHHHGKFSVTSKLNEGTTVHIRLPKA